MLVSDVEAAAPAHELVRGDVITALDDEPVVTVRDLTSRAETRAGADPIRLSVRRAGRPLKVHFVAE